MTAISTDEQYRILRGWAVSGDASAVAAELGLKLDLVTHIVTTVAGLNRSFARTLVAGYERQQLARAAMPVRRVGHPAPPALAQPRPEPRPQPPPEPVVVAPEPDPEPEPEPVPEPLPAWPGWLCEQGRRYRDNGPHGAPKRCGCRMEPIVVGGGT